MTRVKPVLVALAASVLLALPSAAPAQGGQSVLAVLFAFPAGAKLLSETNIPIQVTGQLTVSFQGSPAAGCAASGVCAYSGTIVVAPGQSELAIEKYRLRGRIGETALLALQPGAAGYTTVAEVQRSGPGQQGGCADAEAPSLLGALLSGVQHGGSLRISLLQAGGTMLSTRCTGPLDGDLASVSPQATLPLRAALRGGRTIDLSASAPFASHGFAGTLDSTLVLKLGRPQVQPTEPTFPPGIKTQRVRTVIERLHPVGASGSLSLAVQGTADPLVCGLLDSCGVTGSLRLGADLHLGTGELVATGPASRPYVDFLAALGLSRTGNRRGITVGGGFELGPGTVTAALSQSGASCTDTAPTGALTVSFEARGSVFAGTAGSLSGWRTRCPGPMLTGVNSVLSVLPVPRSEFARKTLTVHVRGSGSLTDDGYSISPHGSLSVTIRRGRLTQTVSPEPTG